MLAFVSLGQGELGPVIALLALGAIAALFFDSLARKLRRSRFPFKQKPDLTDVGQQMRAVMAGSFEKRRLLSFAEYRIFTIVEGEIEAHRKGHRVFAQTSLGEVLAAKDHEAFASINSKRVDILVIDKWGWPFLAIEYQGDGHYQGTAAARDAVKKEALRKAGVRYIEFASGDTDSYIRLRLREHLGIAESAKVRSV